MSSAYIWIGLAIVALWLVSSSIKAVGGVKEKLTQISEAPATIAADLKKSANEAAGYVYKAASDVMYAGIDATKTVAKTVGNAAYIFTPMGTMQAGYKIGTDVGIAVVAGITGKTSQLITNELAVQESLNAAKIEAFWKNPIEYTKGQLDLYNTWGFEVINKEAAFVKTLAGEITRGQIALSSVMR